MPCTIVVLIALSIQGSSIQYILVLNAYLRKRDHLYLKQHLNKHLTQEVVLDMTFQVGGVPATTISIVFCVVKNVMCIHLCIYYINDQGHL